MNYELTKELKDAGFPQGTSDNADNCDIHWHRDMNDITNPNTETYYPTLSELIVACGESPYFNLEKSTYGWDAFVNNGEEVIGRGKGLTPEEAVARLWLALNKQ